MVSPSIATDFHSPLAARRRGQLGHLVVRGAAGPCGRRRPRDLEPVVAVSNHDGVPVDRHGPTKSRRRRPSAWPPGRRGAAVGRSNVGRARPGRVGPKPVDTIATGRVGAVSLTWSYVAPLVGAEDEGRSTACCRTMVFHRSPRSGRRCRSNIRRASAWPPRCVAPPSLVRKI